MAIAASRPAPIRHTAVTCLVHGGAARLDRGGHVAVSRRRASRGDVCAVQGGGTGGRRPLRYVGASGIAADARGAVARLSVRRWVPRDLHAQTNPGPSRVPPPLAMASGGGLHPCSGPRAVYGKLTNRSRKSVALAAPPSIGVVTPKISCTVRSVELWSYGMVFWYPTLALGESEIMPIGPSPLAPSSQVMKSAPLLR